jgi:hypothetical protein
MDAVLQVERRLGYEPRDVSAEKIGYDVESRDPRGGPLRFLEVKGRIAGASTVTVTKNEILTALNEPGSFILALVEVPPSEELPVDVHAVHEGRSGYGPPPGCRVRYLRSPFQREPDFNVTSVNYDWRELWQRGEDPLAHVPVLPRVPILSGPQPRRDEPAVELPHEPGFLSHQ